MPDPDKNPHLGKSHWSVRNGSTDWLPQLSPHYVQEQKEVTMSPANFRRWRRILIWSIITGGFVFTLGYLYGSIT